MWVILHHLMVTGKYQHGGVQTGSSYTPSSAPNALNTQPPAYSNVWVILQQLTTAQTSQLHGGI